jgi:hypothetical protein
MKLRYPAPPGTSYAIVIRPEECWPQCTCKSDLGLNLPIPPQDGHSIWIELKCREVTHAVAIAVTGNLGGHDKSVRRSFPHNARDIRILGFETANRVTECFSDDRGQVARTQAITKPTDDLKNIRSHEAPIGSSDEERGGVGGPEKFGVRSVWNWKPPGT